MSTERVPPIKKVLDPYSIEQTAAEITHLIEELNHIYRTKHHFEFPLELLEYSRFFEIYSKMQCDLMQEPIKSLRTFEAFLQEWNDLSLMTFNKITTGNSFINHQFYEPSDDKRFSHPAWNKNDFLKSLKRGYFLITRYTLKWLHSLETIDKKTKQQLHLYVKNTLDFFSPTNYILTNPEVMQKTIETNGENLFIGFKNFLEDLVLNKGRLNIRTTDLHAFGVGENLAITPGKIIYQNDLMQLIQYLPSTETVYKIPILFIPPWINKYYILDLAPENSMVKWLVSQGFTVYMISWVNPDAKLSHKSFSDYMCEGPLAALDVIEKSIQSSNVHMVGYCIGGTLLGATLAYMAHKKDFRAKSATYFMSLLDFSNPGELGLFIDELQISVLRKIMEKQGYLYGRLLELSFHILRPNELIWPYFINNYLLGKSPKPFDLLYWNTDSTNMPYKMFCFYLTNMYLKNRLKKPNAITLNETPINLAEVKTPSLFIASKTDHITLWRAVYQSARLVSGPTHFILSDSGHVRGVVNPPHPNNKYKYRTSETLGITTPLPKKAREWKEATEEHAGSWWPYWVEWLIKFDNERVPARDPLKSGFPIIEDAPGSYVRRKI